MLRLVRQISRDHWLGPFGFTVFDRSRS